MMESRGIDYTKLDGDNPTLKTLLMTVVLCRGRRRRWCRS